MIGPCKTSRLTLNKVNDDTMNLITMVLAATGTFFLDPKNVYPVPNSHTTWNSSVSTKGSISWVVCYQAALPHSSLRRRQNRLTWKCWFQVLCCDSPFSCVESQCCVDWQKMSCFGVMSASSYVSSKHIFLLVWYYFWILHLDFPSTAEHISGKCIEITFGLG